MTPLFIIVIATMIASRLAITSNLRSLDACRVYCEGDLLEAVQMNRIFNDSKTFVDMPMRYDPQQILDAFAQLPTHASKQEIESFVYKHFDAAGSDMQEWIPDDYVDDPEFLSHISDPDLREWAKDIHALWLVLGRQHKSDVVENPQRHSFLPSKFPFIVAGGRFREVYYWDSYWILKGLLVSGMRKTALQTILNMMGVIEEFGLMPNGLRIYYLNRSQPPLLSEMVATFISSGEYPTDFVQYAAAILDREYAFWMDHTKGHSVKIVGENGRVYTLNRYFANTTSPRPESYYEDEEIAQELSPEKRPDFFSDIAAAAESGWDFSSRWLENGKDLSAAYTRRVIPVELNCIMHRMEQNLAKLHRILNNQEKVAFYDTAAAQRVNAMQELMWNNNENLWVDLIINTLECNSYSPALTSLNENTNNCIVQRREISFQSRSISQYLPLWSRSFDPVVVSESRVLDSLLASGLVLEGGFVTTLETTGLQWDFPNAWAPLQQFMIEGLSRIQTDIRGPQLASRMANVWISSTYSAYVETGFMHEKYDARYVGGVGAGGEYEPQIGFGWTNGVALTLMMEYNVNLD